MKAILRFLLIPGALIAMTTAADAQLSNVAENNLEVTIDGKAEVLIGIDDCERSLDDEFRIVARLDDGYGLSPWYLRIVQSDSESPSSCERDEMIECARASTGACECVNELSNARSVQETRTIAELLEGDTESVCVDHDTDLTFRFFATYYSNASRNTGIFGNNNNNGDDEETAQSEPARLVFDLKRPARPSAPPTIRNADAALEVEFEPEVIEDVDKHEVCYIRADQYVRSVDETEAESGDDNDTSSLTRALTGQDQNFTCIEVSRARRSQRIEGLDNGVTYKVGFAAIDDAGNSGELSPVVEGTPGRVFDFAELYRLKGGEEVGGCEATSSRHTGGNRFLSSAALAIVALLLRRRRA